MTSKVQLKDTISSPSVKLLPSAPNPPVSSHHAPLNTPLVVNRSPLSSLLLLLYFYLHPSHLLPPFSLFFILRAPSFPFILLYDPTLSSLCPSSITPSPLVGHMILVSLPPSLCLHTVMIQNPRPPQREGEGGREMEREGEGGRKGGRERL